ncbi:MAG: sigma 54-interacting transcriptional regulator, partial [Alphaproteobacteria bacterium]|nr:sigma 54-interacting transcriptional regulator [Alphaproteobacteria bacterium]
MSYAVLIIEDEETLARNILRYLERAGYEARVANDGKSGLRLFESFKPDVVLLDLRLPDLDGVEILKRIRATDETIKVLMMTAHGTVVNAVKAMKAGAHDYLTKPIVLSDLKRVLERTIGDEQVKGTLSYYLRRAGGTGGLGTLIGESKAIVAIKDKIHQLIEADRRLEAGLLAPVLITGETGTGKDLVAAAIHHEGPRGDSPFIEINCAGMPPTLVEEELFGHERGAFTDAKERKIGLFEAANGGTLFLNEVGELEIGVQAK